MNFLETIYHNLQQQPDAAVIREICDQQVVETTAADLVQQIRRARHFIAKKGVQPGDHVALLAPNSSRWIAAELAILSAGAIAVPLYHRQSCTTLGAMLSDCQPRLTLVDKSVIDQVKEQSVYGIVSPLDEAFDASPTQLEPYPLLPNAVVAIIYTSGTSGLPKGAMLTRANFDYMVPLVSQQIETIAQLDISQQNNAFHFLPFCFAPAHLILWAQLYKGQAIALCTKLENLAADLRLADPTFFLTVPMVLERFRKATEQTLADKGKIFLRLISLAQRAYNGTLTGSIRLDDLIFNGLKVTLLAQIKRAIAPSLKLIICGSAPLQKETQSWFEMVGIPIYQGYGLTETTGLVTLDRLQENVPGFVGYAIPGCEVRLTPDKELICRGPNIFAGYWNNPDATKQAIRNGWLYTGDRACINLSGNWQLLGRLKNLLVLTSGHNIAPEPLEQKLLTVCARTHVDIKQVAIVGHARPFLTAVFSTSADESALETAIEQFNTAAPHYQKIRKFYRSCESFTLESGLLTANGKLRRAEIERYFQPQLEALYRSVPSQKLLPAFSKTSPTTTPSLIS